MAHDRYIPGPTYDEMRDPSLLPAATFSAAQRAYAADELNPINLFNIHWCRADARTPRYFVFPPTLTGVPCNIIVMEGAGFPSGSHKVGPAYSTLAEHEVDGTVDQSMTVVGPSTGNFGIGVTYVANLKGYKPLVVMPDGMSAERYARIKRYGGVLDLTPGTESDVVLVLERVQELKQDPRMHILAQFELMPNYRFHRHVTGAACQRAASTVGNGRVAAFVSAPGSAGTLAAGDHLKHLFPETQIVAVEPEQCQTLTDGSQGQHRIEGIGDKMCVLIHNVLTTDWLCTVNDDDTVRALYLMHFGRGVLGAAPYGVHAATLDTLASRLGISGMCNVIAAIKTAKKLGLKGGDNVVTIATDGFDRYPSVMEDLVERSGGSIAPRQVESWARETLAAQGDGGFTDVSGPDEKKRLFGQKENDWVRFGYTVEYLDDMKSADFWEEEYQKIIHYDRAIARLRERHGGVPIP